MKQKDIQFGEAGQRRFFRILSFLIPFAVMLVSFTMLGIYPFGDKGPALHGDACVEYYPFLVLMRRLLANGESLLYTWRAGLGTAVVPEVLASFCTSPINLLGFLLPESLYAHYLSFGVCLRFGLSGYFLSILFQQISDKADASVPVFCTAYVLNMWMLTFYWQITLLGVVTILPLVLLGVLKLVRYRDMRLFPLMLGVSMLMNSYMTIFTAIITGFFWIGLLIVLDKSWRQIPGELLRFLGLSVLGAGFSAVLVLPSLSAISATGNFEDTAFHWTEFYTDFMTLTGQLVSGVWPNINAQPADFAGSILLVVLVLGYLTMPTIRLRERLYTFFVAAFIFVSLTYSPLNLIWHGMHYPYVTVQRFAFLLPLVLAFMGWRYTQNMHPEKLPEDSSSGRKAGRVFLTMLQFLLMAGFTAGVCWCAYQKDLTDIIYLPLAAAGIILLLYLFYRCFPKQKLMFHTALLVVVTAELSLCTWLTISRNDRMLNDSKISCSTSEKVENALHAVSADAEGQIFYRSGYYNGQINSELLYDDVQGGSCTFSSLIPRDLKRLCVKLGMADQTTTSKYYALDSLPPLSSLLLDMQYVVSDNPSLDQLVLYNPLNGDAETANAYRLAYDTALGFIIDDNVKLDELPDTALMDVQDALANRLTGETERMMEDTDISFRIDESFLSDAEAKLTDGSKLSFKSAEEPERSTDASADADYEEALHPHVKLLAKVSEDGIYWLNLEHSDSMRNSVKRWNVYAGDRLVCEKTLNLLENAIVVDPEQSILLGELKAGTEISVTYYLFTDSEGEAELKLTRFREDVFKRVYDKLMDSPFTLTEFNSDNFTGTVNTENNALLYLSLPYRKGWTAYVDGAATNTVPALDGMTGVYLMAGEHTVKLEYHQPLLFEGAMVSLGCFALYLILVLIQQIRRRIAKKRGYSDSDALPETPAQKPAASAPEMKLPLPALPKQAVPKPPVPKASDASAPVTRTEQPKPAAAQPPAAPKPDAPAAPKPVSGHSEGQRKKSGLYENHRPQRLRPEDEPEARFVKGAHFAGDDGDDDADD